MAHFVEAGGDPINISTILEEFETFERRGRRGESEEGSPSALSLLGQTSVLVPGFLFLPGNSLPLSHHSRPPVYYLRVSLGLLPVSYHASGGHSLMPNIN